MALYDSFGHMLEPSEDYNTKNMWHVDTPQFKILSCTFDCDKLPKEACALDNWMAATLDHYCNNGEHKEYKKWL